MTSKIQPLSERVGACVELDVSSPVSPDERAWLRKALLDHCVLLFRGQKLTRETQLRFASNFGEVHQHARYLEKTGDAGSAQMQIVSNTKQGGLFGAADLAWHTDNPFVEHPPSFTLAGAVEVPSSGGDTYWANTYAAYEALDEKTRARLAGARVRHAGNYDKELKLKPVADEPEKDYPVADHPAVRIHPETGRPALYFGTKGHRQVLGMNDAESDALTDELERITTQAKFVYRHHWELGDLIIWDNRCTMHRRDSFPAEESRTLLRCMVG